jgi:predicted PurR-regulated permease PerM
MQDFLRKLPGMISGSFGSVLGAVGSALSWLVTVGTTLVLTLYFLLAWPRILTRADRLLRHRARVEIAHESLGKIGGYVTGQLCVSALAGVAAYVFLKATGVPYPSLLAVVVGVCDLIPQVGATLGAAVCVLVALSESIGIAVVTAVFFLIYQHIENYLIVPRMFARTVALSPITVFISALARIAVGGFVAAVVALPCVAAAKVVLRYVLRDRLAELEAEPLP